MKYLYLITTLFVSALLLSCVGDKTPAKPSNGSAKNAKVQEKRISKKIAKEESNKVVSNKEAEEEQSEPIPKEQLDKANKVINAVGDVSAIDAKRIFKINCTICHGLKGNMMINGAKDLTKSKINLTNSVAQVYFGKGLMTPYSNILSDEEIVAVAKYSETLRK